jgi:hypothetical protein
MSVKRRKKWALPLDVSCISLPWLGLDCFDCDEEDRYGTDRIRFLSWKRGNELNNIRIGFSLAHGAPNVEVVAVRGSFCNILKTNESP